MAQIIIDGIPIDVQRKRIKNMYLRVLAPAGNVLLTAPMRVSDAKVAQFARTRIDWVKRAREKCLAAGATDAIAKPFEPINLFSILDRHLTPPPTG